MNSYKRIAIKFLILIIIPIIPVCLSLLIRTKPVENYINQAIAGYNIEVHDIRTTPWLTKLYIKSITLKNIDKENLLHMEKTSISFAWPNFLTQEIIIPRISIERASLYPTLTSLSDELILSSTSNFIYQLTSKKITFDEIDIKVKDSKQDNNFPQIFKANVGYSLDTNTINIVIASEPKADTIIADSCAISSKLQINLNSSEIEGDFHIEKLDLSSFNKQLQGGIIIDSNVTGTLNKLTLNNFIHLNAARYKNYPILAKELKTTINYDATTSQSEILIATPNENWIFTANMQTGTNNIDIQDILLSGPKSTLSGNINIDTNTNLADGLIEWSSDDIKVYKNLLNINASGTIKTSISLQKDNKNNKQMLDLKASARKLLLSNVYFKTLNIKAGFEDIFSFIPKNINIDAIDFRYLGLRKASELSFETSSADASRFKTRLIAKEKNNLNLDISGELLVKNNSQNIDLSLDKVSIISKGISAKNKDDIKFGYHNKNLTWEGELSFSENEPQGGPHPTNAESQNIYKSIYSSGKIQSNDIALHLNMHGIPLAISKAIIPKSHKLTGNLSGKIDCTGNVSNPNISGNLKLTAGSYAYPSLGIKLRNTQFEIVARSSHLLLNDFIAYDSKKNILSAKGDLNIKDAKLPFNLSVNTSGFHLINNKDLRGKFNANLQITGDINNAKIKGLIKPNPLEIELGEGFESRESKLNIVEIITDEPEAEDTTPFKPITITQNQVTPRYSYPIFMDIKLSAQKQVFVRGLGLDTELGGSLQILGTLDMPKIYGNLESIRGRYTEFGKELKIREGVLAFEGVIPPSPYLKVEGVNMQGNVEIRILLTGSVLKPKLSVESTPALPKDEILSLLLFGESAQNISAFQAFELANSLQHLSGKGTNVDILGNVRKLLRVDNIKIKNSETTPSVAVGKYVSDKIYLEVERGMEAQSSKTSIEVELKSNLSVESSISEDGKNSVGINWKRNY